MASHNEPRVDGHNEIELSQGHFALVSSCDVPAVSALRWHAVKCGGGKLYARRSVKVGGKIRSVYMHRFLMSSALDDGLEVDHINGNGLDNRRENLRVVDVPTNRRNTQTSAGASGFRCVFPPPYTKGEMDYGAGGMGLGIADDVREWCAQNGQNKALRIVLCGHAGEHDALLAQGWQTRSWAARKGYAVTDEAVENSASETIWCSPHCAPEVPVITDLFAESA